MIPGKEKEHQEWKNKFKGGCIGLSLIPSSLEKETEKEGREETVACIVAVQKVYKRMKTEHNFR